MPYVNKLVCFQSSLLPVGKALNVVIFKTALIICQNAFTFSVDFNCHPGHRPGEKLIKPFLFVTEALDKHSRVFFFGKTLDSYSNICKQDQNLPEPSTIYALNPYGKLLALYTNIGLG